jgi:hypothetical protein
MLLFIYLETGSHYVAQAGLELVILLPQPPTCWDCGCPPLHPAFIGAVHKKVKDWAGM